MGKKNKQKLDMNDIVFEESSYYDSEEDYENSRSSKKNKKERRRERRNSYDDDYYSDNSYDDYEDNARAFNGYSDQGDDSFADEYSHVNDIEKQDDCNGESEDESCNFPEYQNSSISLKSDKGRGSNERYSTNTSYSASSNDTISDSSIFRETASTHNHSCISGSNNGMGMSPRAALSQDSNNSRSSGLSFSFSTGNKAPLHPVPKPAVTDDDNGRRDSKELSSGGIDDVCESDLEGSKSEKKSRKKREKELAEERCAELERKELKARLDDLETEISRLDESINEEGIEDRSLKAKRNKLEKERLTLLIQQKQWDFEACIALLEQSDDGDETLLDEKSQIGEELRRLKNKRRNLFLASFLPLSWASVFGSSLKSQIDRAFTFLKGVFNHNSVSNVPDQGIEQEESQGEDDMGSSKRKNKAIRRKERLREDSDDNATDYSNSEEYDGTGGSGDYARSLGDRGGRNWRDIFKRTAIVVTAVSLVLTIGYSGWLIYGGQKEDNIDKKNTIASSSSGIDSNAATANLTGNDVQRSDSKKMTFKGNSSKSDVAKKENAGKKEGGLGNRLKSLVSWKRADNDKEQAKKLQNKDKDRSRSGEGKNVVQVNKKDNPLLKNDNLKDEIGLEKFANDSEISPNKPIDDIASITNDISEDIVDERAGLSSATSEIASDLVADFSDFSGESSKNDANFIEQAKNSDSDSANESISDEGGLAIAEALISDVDETNEENSSNDSNPVPQVLDPVATFGNVLSREDESIDSGVSSNPMDIASTSPTPSEVILPSASSASSSLPSGADWDDEPTVADSGAEPKSVSSEESISAIINQDSSTEETSTSAYAALDENPTFRSAQVNDGWNASLDNAQDTQTKRQSNVADLGDVLSVDDSLSNENETGSGSGILALDDEPDNASYLSLNESSDGRLSVLDEVADVPLPDVASGFDTYAYDNLNDSNDSNLLAPLATSGAPIIENNLDMEEPSLNLTLSENALSSASGELENSSVEATRDLNGLADGSFSVLDSNEDGSRVSSDLNKMSGQISGVFDDLSEQSSALSEQLNKSASNLQTDLQKGLDSANKRINSGLETVQNWSQQVSDGLTETSNSLSNSIVDTIDNVDNSLRDTYDNITDSLSNAYHNTLDSLQEAGNSLQSNYQDVRDVLTNGTQSSLQNDGLNAVVDDLKSPSETLLSLENNSFKRVGVSENELSLEQLGGEGIRKDDSWSPSNTSSPLTTSGSSSLANEMGIRSDTLVNANIAENGNEANNFVDTLNRDLTQISPTDDSNNVVDRFSNAESVDSGAASGALQELADYGTNSNGNAGFDVNSADMSVPVYGSTNVSSIRGDVNYATDNYQYSQGDNYSSSGAYASNSSQVGNPYGNSNNNYYGNDVPQYYPQRGYDNVYSSNSYSTSWDSSKGDESNRSVTNNSRRNNSYYADNSDYGNRFGGRVNSGVRDSYREYITKEGDNLLTIAENELGSSSRWGEIKRLNNLRSGATYFEVGTRIKLPVSSKTD